ncbi:Rieske (2Fe-2S) protein [Marinobacterium arenosum]|uniref:Rieske (2Fe-2S) protein n=1 Tax=Marinobacterium arenosum TaxID=2862496 RepID=UPI001C951CAA|nr:Rieske 2Fe-2S domain-containing protein [Marinobacterium arenosum]MBY4678294.1 Rieske 2Fe-2S domain-containing protein [Marinobacterium arenosum]
MIRLCAENEIADNSAKGLQAGERALVAVRKHGQLYLYENNCPHRSIPLEWMPDQFLDVEKNFLQCATHGALFKIDSGECVFGPCVGDALTSVPFELRDGALWINQG